MSKQIFNEILETVSQFAHTFSNDTCTAIALVMV